MEKEKLPRKTLLSLLLTVIVLMPGISQEWQWEWGRSCTQKGEQAWSYIEDVDAENNLYTATQYGDSISFGDTTFNHPNAGYYSWANWAIAKYSSQGDFLNALNIYTLPDKLIFGIDVTTDADLNMYVAGQFQQEVYIQDTVIYHGNVPVPDAPELFLVKLNPSFEIEWIRLISGPYQDECQGLGVSPEGHVFMATHHYGNGYNEYTIDFFGQDSTTQYYTTCQLLKISPEGDLLWRKEMYSENAGMMIMDMNLDQSSDVTLNGYVYEDLQYDGIFVPHPHPLEYERRPFILRINGAGELVSGTITDWSMVLSDTDVDDEGNFYFAGFVWDTLYFGNDTLIQHEDSTKNILAKLDADLNPVWYETTATKSDQGSYFFYVDSWSDTLFFAGRCKGYISMFDTLFTLGQYYEMFVGQVTPEGDLDQFLFTHSQYGSKPHGLTLDNCNNLIVSGQFRGYTYLGQDTLYSGWVGDWDGLLTKINRYGADYFSFGTDTTVCDSITLYGPEGYSMYYWNGLPSSQNSFVITQTGEYIFACHSEAGCWLRDTIQVVVQPGFFVDLGSDTTITSLDTVHFEIPDVFESYLWSTGETTHSINVTGSELGVGNWNIWVEVNEGVCFASDTIALTVISNIAELEAAGINIYPNPVEDILTINSMFPMEQVELIDFSRKVIFDRSVPATSDNKMIVNLIALPPGVYIVKISMEKTAVYGKLIKL